jgi:hypothetical protein
MKSARRKFEKSKLDKQAELGPAKDLDVASEGGNLGTR